MFGGRDTELADFRRQLAAVRTYSDDFCWVYGHGSTWWQVTPVEADRYGKLLNSFPRENYLVSTVPNIGEYYRAAAERNVVREKGR